MQQPTNPFFRLSIKGEISHTAHTTLFCFAIMARNVGRYLKRLKKKYSLCLLGGKNKQEEQRSSVSMGDTLNFY
jgi:hypothetical protein